MSPGIHLALGQDRRRGTKDGDQMDLQTLDSTTTIITTDTATLVEDSILREVPELSTTAPEDHRQAQEPAHLHHLDLVVEAHQ
jgi:hypothetical protein